jgi:hypothetical protein
MEQPGVSGHAVERGDCRQEQGAVGAVDDGNAAGPERGAGPLAELGRHRQQRVFVQVAHAVAATRDRRRRHDDRGRGRFGGSEHTREPVLT